MPSPVESRSDASNYYDYENAECIGEDPSTFKSGDSPEPVKRSEGAAPSTSRAAVDQLVKAASRKPSCGDKIADAALTCTSVAATAVAGTATGPLDLLIVGTAGAACGLKVAKAIDCESE